MKLNGNLVLNTGGQSEIQNLVVERISTTMPTFLASEKGRLVFFNNDGKFYINDGVNWVSLATGGNATALQGEVDNVETALGSFVNANGTFNGTSLDALASVTGATSLLDALTQMDLAMSGKDQLSELLDTTITTAASGEALVWTGTTWANTALTLANISDITASAAEVNQLAGSGIATADLTKLHAVTSSAVELNKLTGATATTIELNYVTGVTSALQPQLDNKQPLDAQLTSLAGLTPTNNQLLFGDGLGGYVLDNAGGAQSRLGLTVGIDVQGYDQDLDQIANFIPAAGDFLVSTGGIEGSRWNLESGATARTSMGLGNIAVMDAASFVLANGTSTITGNIKLDGFKLTNVGTPTVGTDATNKTYVDSAIAGLSWKQSVEAGTTANITLSGTQTVDGVALVAGNRVLVKDQTIQADNGIYVVAAGAWTRATDFDSVSPIDEINSSAVFVRGGTINGDQGFTEISTVVTVGTDAITFTPFSGATSFVDGIGLLRTGNQVDVNMGAGIVALPSDEVGIDIYNSANAALILTSDGSTSNTLTGSQLHLKTNLLQFNQDATNGLFLKASGVSELELSATVAGAGLIGGAGTPLAVVSAPGTASTVGTLVVTADAVGVALGTTSTTAAPGDHIHSAAVVTYSNTTSGLLATDTQAAIDEVEGRVGIIETTATALNSEVNAIETAVGLSTSGTFVADSTTNYLAAATSVQNANNVLDTTIKAVETGVAARVAGGYFLYDGVSATSHTVTHNIGSQYCNVTVIDSVTNEQIIPNSVTFDSTTGLTVTLNTALAIKVVVMGLAGYTAV